MNVSIKSIISLLFHIFVVVHHTCAWSYLPRTIEIHTVTDQTVLDVFVFAPVFVTSWNLIIHIVYFGLAAWDDILRIFSIKPNLRKKLKKQKGYIFTSFLFPATLYVSIVFWAIYNLNREWILPEVLDEHIPSWLNHFLHTNISVFVVFEVLLTNQLLPTFESAFKGITVATALYHIALLSAYAASGRWAYRFLNILIWPEIIFLFIFNYFFVVASVQLWFKIQYFKLQIYSSRLVALNKVK